MDKGHLVVAVFEDETAATAAADWLNNWQKTQKDVDDTKFKAMAVLTSDENNEIKTHRVGRHNVAGGAGWGLAIGALAGLLTGGIGILGGLAAGALIGGVGGGLIHKGLGIYEYELADLADQLCSGHAALAVVVDEPGIEPTMAQLIDLGASPQVYECSLGALEEGAGEETGT